MAFTKSKDRPARRLSRTERKRIEKAALATIERPPVDDPARRAELEADPARWLMHYLGEVFPLPFGEVHRQIIAAAVRTIREGSGLAVAAPRGTGKSSILWGVALWAVLSGACRFPVVAGWSHSAARRMLRKWIAALATNTRLAADYPETCVPFTLSTHSNRLRGLKWKDVGTRIGADVRTADGLIVLPDSQGALGAVSISGNVRGLHAGLPDGSTIRPDVLFLDDPQDKLTAESPQLARKAMDRITSDMFSISGPDKRLAVMAATTVIGKDDVAERLLKHPDFEPIRVPQITRWPDGFTDRASPARRLWDEWNAERVEGLADRDGGARARKFYDEHKAEMLAGMTTSWDERFDRDRGDPDSMFAAMWDFYRIGEAAFMSERQNTPTKPESSTYELTPTIIAAKVYPGRRRCEVPADARILVAATDVNHYGLHSAVLAFSNDQTASVVWYGRFDRNGAGIIQRDTPEQQAKRQAFEALVQHGEQIARLPLVQDGRAVRPQLWLVDGGYMPDAVRRFIEGPARTIGVPAGMFRGFSATAYRPTGKNVIGLPREQCHFAESPVAGRFVAGNADYWREVMQRSFLGTPGAPGSISLYDGEVHAEIAEHIAREKLVEKLQGQYGPVWRWAIAPGWHDYGDALVMCYVAGAWQGIGTTTPAPQRRRPVARKPIMRWATL